MVQGPDGGLCLSPGLRMEPWERTWPFNPFKGTELIQAPATLWKALRGQGLFVQESQIKISLRRAFKKASVATRVQLKPTTAGRLGLPGESYRNVSSRGGQRQLRLRFPDTPLPPPTDTIGKPPLARVQTLDGCQLSGNVGYFSRWRSLYTVHPFSPR